ncbi:hypothetical protein [Runella zeae]|uniref:hypothetical protein n=1 Tax=Runella zeae TaxID=94255 RepID=UPI00056CCC17|nr:hypothetical protein [Runella zeae]
MIYLTKQQIIRLNIATIEAHGGNFMPPNNFLHEENLDYLLEAVQAEMFGEPLYLIKLPCIATTLSATIFLAMAINEQD